MRALARLAAGLLAVSTGLPVPVPRQRLNPALTAADVERAALAAQKQ